MIAPHFAVLSMTEAFLVAFGLESLWDLPNPEQLADAGMGGM